MASFTTDATICIQREIQVNRHNPRENLISTFNVIETCNWIKENFSKVCLQFPDELLNVSATIYEEIKKRVDIDLYILGDTTYASCCVDSVAAMHVEGDAIVHYGHTCFSKTNLPVFYVLPKRDLHVKNILGVLQQKFSSNDNLKLCLFYDAEFHHCKDELSKQWYEVYPQSFVAFIQINENPKSFLGRVIRNKNGEDLPLETLKDCVCVYIGSRGQTLFNYTISIAALEWHFLDPDIMNIECLNETTWFKRRRYLIEKCKDANMVGILVCKLAGEQTREIITRMKQLCRVSGKKSYIVSVGKPNVAKLANFPEIDIYVMIACPENDLYSNRDLYTPIVYPFELEVALNSNREQYFTNHITDYDELLPGKRHHCDIAQIVGTDVSLITGKIRETKINENQESSTDLLERQNWALDNIGGNLQARSWKGLEQKLGETEVKMAEEGRKGIPLQYVNEPE